MQHARSTSFGRLAATLHLRHRVDARVPHESSARDWPRGTHVAHAAAHHGDARLAYGHRIGGVCARDVGVHRDQLQEDGTVIRREGSS